MHMWCSTGTTCSTVGATKCFKYIAKTCTLLSDEYQHQPCQCAKTSSCDCNKIME